MSTGLRLSVLFLDNQRNWYQLGEGRGWRIDPVHRAIVIGRGIERIIIPLDNVRLFEFEPPVDDDPAAGAAAATAAAVVSISSPPTPKDVFSGGITINESAYWPVGV